MLKATDIELAVARHFHWQQNIIIPNVGFVLGLYYEADLVVLRPSGYAVEVEIKVSSSDLRRDTNKEKWRTLTEFPSPLFRTMYFAVPENLRDHPNIPSLCGVLSVSEELDVQVMRRPKINKLARKLDLEEQHKLMQLGCRRLWTLKTKMQQLNQALHRRDCETKPD